MISSSDVDILGWPVQMSFNEICFICVGEGQYSSPKSKITIKRSVPV